MDAEEPSPLRIGHAERTAAQRALDEHLEAGRLGVGEYADRSAAAANALVAADLAALFTDLPEPHPRLPGRATPAPPTGEVTPSTPGTVERWGPQLMAVAVAVAVGLFFLTRVGPVLLLIPLAAVVLWTSRRG